LQAGGLLAYACKDNPITRGGERAAPSQGDAIVAAGELMDFPDANTTGSDTFTYEVCGTSGNCGAARVAVAVVANDQDADGDRLTVVDHDDTSALGGSVTCGTASCTYTPPTLWPGPDTFDYTISDAVGARSTATVTITSLTPDVGWTLTAAGPGNQTSTPVLPLAPGAARAANTSLPNSDTDREPARPAAP
jgi:hypothetical protein